MKDSFILYTSQYNDAVKGLTLENKGRLFEAIYLYARGEEVVIEDPAASMAFAFIRERIDRDSEKYDDIVAKRSAAGKIHRGNQYTRKNEQNCTNGTNLPDTKEKTNVDVRKENLCKTIASIWNEICVSLPKVNKVTADRSAKIKARLKEWGDDKDKQTEMAREIFKKIEASDFLTGRRGDWKCSFDWIVKNGGNWLKVMEGNYSNTGTNADQIQSEYEYRDGEGNRFYGESGIPIPKDAPPRPDKYSLWSPSEKRWVIEG